MLENGKYVGKNYFSKVQENEEDVDHGKEQDLPDFSVVNPNKPGKLRIVYGGSSKSNGSSLNDFLLTAPDIYNSLLTILSNLSFKK